MAFAKKIRVIILPHGEAPEEVGTGWMGCVLPCEPECGHIPKYVGSVLTGPSLEKITGFSVPQNIALAVLERNAPDAARWFREHGFPKENDYFHFKTEEVEGVEFYTEEEERALGPIHVYDDMETGSMRKMS